MTTSTSKPLNIIVNDKGYIVIKFADSTIEGEKLKEDVITNVKLEGDKDTQDDFLLFLGVLLEQALKNQEAEMKSGKSEGNNAVLNGIMDGIMDAMSSIGEVVQGLVNAMGGDVQSGQEVKTIDCGTGEFNKLMEDNFGEVTTKIRDGMPIGWNRADFDKFFKKGNFGGVINKRRNGMLIAEQAYDNTRQEADKSEENSTALSIITDGISAMCSSLSSMIVTEESEVGAPSSAPSSTPSKASAAVVDVREVPPSSRV